MRNLLLDLASGLVLLALYLITGNIYLATAAGMVVGVALIGWKLARKERIDLMAWATLALVLVLGGATIVTHNALFVKLKPTIAEAIVGAVMLEPGWLARYMPQNRVALFPRRVIVGHGYVYTVALFSLAIANLAVALTTDTKTWAIYNGVIPFIVFPLLAVGVFLNLRRIARKRIAEGAAVPMGTEP